MSLRFIGLTVLLSTALLTACGDDKGSTSSSSGGSSSGTTSSSGDPPSGGDVDAGTTTTPKATGPRITQIMKMTGSLHVVWELPETCDGVELERKDGDAEYKVAYELPGSVDNKHDATATENMVYTYRARCKLGADYTEYSNEMGKNPI